MSQIVVFFNGETGDYLDVREMTETLIRGWVINGHWEMVIDRVNNTVSLDQSQDGDGSLLEQLSTFDTLDIIPVKRSGEYNRVIERAREILRDRKIQVIPATPPPCHACGAPTKWSVANIEGGSLAECSV